MSESNEFDPTIDSSRIQAIRDTPADHTGKTIGPYRILGKLGEGGMGIVFDAEQAHPKRRVALKVIRGGEFLDEIRVRLFRREVETLARLKHPNIGAIYDAGVTGAGEHYFAMELVLGKTLDAWLAARPAPDNPTEVRFRLRLFRSICDAVNYAHQRGVIHRDLKPSNIVVALDEEAGPSGTPVIKILDFGLARLAEPDLGNSLKTEVGTVTGTLAYMSPEQARGNPADIDLRTDVYSLGIVLYEMVTGIRPYDVGSSSLLEAVRIICENPPAPLSRVLTGSLKLDQDIETIVHHALEKDVEQRYPSAGDLSEDIGRYLESRPITARPPSRVYRLRKFTQRNRFMVAAMTSGVVAFTAFGLREASMRRAADEARRGIQTVVEFQQEMLAGVDAAKMGQELKEDLKSRLETSLREGGAGEPEIAAAMSVFDRDISRISMTDAALRVIDANILNRALATAETRFAGKPLIRAGLLQSIGETYSSLGLVAEADSTLQAARALYVSELGAGSLKAADVAEGLATMYTAGGEFEKAEPLHLEVVETRRRKLGADNPKTLVAVGELALMRGDQGRAAEAESLYTVAMKGMIRAVGEEKRETLNIMNNYAWFLYEQQRFAEAESLCTRTVALRRRVQGNEHPETLDTINNLAVLYKKTGRNAEAEPLYREGYEASRRLLGDEHPNTLPSMSNLGRLLLAQGKLEEAELILRRAAVTARKVLPPAFFGRGVILQGWGEALVALKRYEEAEDPMLEAYSILFNLDPENPGIRYAVGSMVTIYQNTGRSGKAAEWQAKLLPAENSKSG